MDEYHNETNYRTRNNELNPERGLIIEKFQPITKKDVDLVKQILEENDEIVIGIGNAGCSHEKGEILTAGERIELCDAVLKSERVDPRRYILIPIENAPEATRWVSEVNMMTPAWKIFYTRNFKNASMFESFRKNYRYDIKTVDEQKPDKDYFLLLADYLRGDKTALDEFRIHIPESAVEYIEGKGLFDRINAIYNRRNSDFNKSRSNISRTLFLGGFQPFTGVYSDNNGHFSNIIEGTKHSNQIVIAIGSAQQDHTDSDPLTAGQRIDIIRHTLISNGISSDKFYTIPVKDIDANACFASKVIALCPHFDSVIAGNDWTKQLFGEGDYKIIPVSRSTIKGTDEQISATKARDIMIGTIKKYHSKQDAVSDATIRIIEAGLSGIIDRHALDKIRSLNVYDIMHFLAYAKE